MLLVALTLMTASGVIAVVGWRRLKTAAGPLQRSRRELQKNLDWFKRTLANDRESETKRFDRAAANLINSEPHQ
jgi:cell division protein FtsL